MNHCTATRDVPFFREDSTFKNESACPDRQNDSQLTDHELEARRRELNAEQRAIDIIERHKLIRRQLVLDKEQLRGAAAFPRECKGCKQTLCQWKPSTNTEERNRQRHELLKELLFVQQQSTSIFSDYKVARSARNGGTTRFHRKDLLHELKSEINDLERQIRFERIDKELQDSYASVGPFIEIEALPGYKTLLSTSNAIVALEREHNKLVAHTVACEVIDGVLNL